MHRIALALATLLLSAPAFAQAPPPPPPGGVPVAGEPPAGGLLAKGIKAGLNIASVVGEDAGDLDTRTGFGAGAFIVYGLGGNLSLQLEALYMQQGASTTSDGIDITIAYDYLQVPALGRLSFPTGGQATPYLIGGASLGVLLSAEVSGNGESFDVKDDASTVDVAIVAGVGIEMPAGQGNLLAELRYARGLVTLDATDSEFAVFNSVLSVLAGFGF